MQARALLGAAFILGFSASASAEVTWRGDFETGDYDQWGYALNPTKPTDGGERENITIVDDPVQAGEHAARIQLHPDDKWQSSNQTRVELQHSAADSAEGATTFFSWYFMIPENVEESYNIAYWEGGGPNYLQAMAFGIEPKDGGTELSFLTRSPATTHWTGALTPGEWHQLAMQILWSESETTGQVSVWFDGTKVVDAVPAQTKRDSASMFIQAGLYRNTPGTKEPVIFLDEATEGTTLEDVLTFSGNGGGTGGAGGGSATGGGSNASGGTSSGTGGATTSTGGTASGAGGASTASGGSTSGGGGSKDDGGCQITNAPGQPSAWAFAGLAAAAVLGFRRRRR